jgi:hypothetical protein
MRPIRCPDANQGLLVYETPLNRVWSSVTPPAGTAGPPKLVPRQATFALSLTGTPGTRHRVRLEGIMGRAEGLRGRHISPVLWREDEPLGPRLSLGVQGRSTDRKCRSRAVAALIVAERYRECRVTSLERSGQSNAK